MKQKCLILSALGLLAAGAIGTTQANYQPVSLTPESFSFDIVVEKEATPPFVLASAVTASMDGGTNRTGATWYEVGYNLNAADTGVPVAGSTIFSETAPDHTFTMPGNYAANNALMLDRALTNGTLTVSSPAAYATLSILAASANGSVEVGYTLRFTDGTSETGSFTSPDWFNGSPTAVTANGRVQLGSGGFEAVYSGNPRLYSIDVAVANPTRAIQSIDFTFNSGGNNGRVVVFAVSGLSGGAFVPITVTGFNQDVVVEATAQQSAPLNATTATMDGGPDNNGNTWYERGYHPLAAETGLPAPGTILTNVAASDHIYRLPASYAQNNAALISAVLPTALLTFATPANQSALSLLAASGGGAVTLQYSVQHTDNTTQLGTITVPDWFNVTPYAFTSRGRVNVETGAFNNVNSENPRLYSIDIPVANTATPVRSIELTYISGGGRAAILALSGTAGAVRPIIETQPLGFTAFAGSTGELAVTVSGTEPISFQWQKDVNGQWTNVTDGGGISGATTARLQFANLTFSQAGNYRLVATNAAGASTTLEARVVVVSDKPDVTSPSDEISSFGGPSPDNEPVANAIDDTTSKYLNFGEGDSSPPFAGPVSLVVTPGMGPTVVNAIRIYTANDAVERDPSDFILEGSNDGGQTFTRIASGPLALPATRNDAGLEVSPLLRANQEVNFSNTTAYLTYRVSFTNVKNNAAANSMQIGELELLGEAGTLQPRLNITLNEDHTVTISWDMGGRLQSAPSLSEPIQWTDVAGSSPVTLPTTGDHRFFRVVQ